MDKSFAMSVNINTYFTTTFTKNPQPFPSVSVESSWMLTAEISENLSFQVFSSLLQVLTANRSYVCSLLRVHEHVALPEISY